MSTRFVINISWFMIIKFESLWNIWFIKYLIILSNAHYVFFFIIKTINRNFIDFRIEQNVREAMMLSKREYADPRPFNASPNIKLFLCFLMSNKINIPYYCFAEYRSSFDQGY